MQHAYRAGAVFAWLGLMVGGCAAISGLSGITEEACAPDCDAGTSTPDATMVNPGDSGPRPGDDAPATAEDSSTPTNDATTTDAPTTDAPTNDGPAMVAPEAGSDAPVTDAHPSTDAPVSTSSCGGETCASAEDAGCCGSECPFAHNYDEDLTPAATFYDCVAVGTYNLTLALDACAAFAGGDGSQCDSAGTYGCNVTLNGQDAGVGDMVCSDGPNASVCDCWGYSGPIVGYVSKGTAKGSAACGCPDPQGGTKWK